MSCSLPRLIPYFLRHPQHLFLLDGGGALLTAGCLGVVTVAFAERFGLPHPVLQGLTVVACLYAGFSLSCFYVVPKQWRRLLTLVWRANVLYCGLMVGVCGYFYPQLTTVGAVYFLGEALVILLLAAVERRVSTAPEPRAIGC